MLSDGDRQWMETRFNSLESKIEKRDSKIHKLEMDLANSPHKCEEEIKRHEDTAWTHNPKKAISMGAGIVAIWEGVRSLFHR